VECDQDGDIARTAIVDAHAAADDEAVINKRVEIGKAVQVSQYLCANVPRKLFVKE